METANLSVRRRIAIIEDDPFWQIQLRHNLNAIDSNLDIRVLSSAEEFMDQNVKLFDLVISDQNLGDGGSGLSVYKHLRESNSQVPFALTSGTGERVFDELGADGLMRPVFIEKPYRFQNFKQQIESMLVVPQAPELVTETNWNAFFGGMALLSAATAIAVVSLYVERFSDLQVRDVQLPNQVIKKLSTNLKEHRHAYVSDEVQKRMDEVIARATRINHMKLKE